MNGTKLTPALMAWGGTLTIATGASHWIVFGDTGDGILLDSFPVLMILLGLIIIGVGVNGPDSSEVEKRENSPSSLDKVLILIQSIYTIIFVYFVCFAPGDSTTHILSNRLNLPCYASILWITVCHS